MAHLMDDLLKARQRCSQCHNADKHCDDICVDIEQRLEKHYDLMNPEERKQVYELVHPGKP